MTWLLVFLFFTGIRAEDCETAQGEAVELLQNYGRSTVQFAKDANAQQSTTTTTTHHFTVCEEVKEEFHIPGACTPAQLAEASFRQLYQPLKVAKANAVKAWKGQQKAAKRALERFWAKAAKYRWFKMWEFPKIRGTLFWGPYNKDPYTI